MAVAFPSFSQVFPEFVIYSDVNEMLNLGALRWPIFCSDDGSFGLDCVQYSVTTLHVRQVIEFASVLMFVGE